MVWVGGPDTGVLVVGERSHEPSARAEYMTRVGKVARRVGVGAQGTWWGCGQRLAVGKPVMAGCEPVVHVFKHRRGILENSPAVGAGRSGHRERTSPNSGTIIHFGNFHLNRTLPTMATTQRPLQHNDPESLSRFTELMNELLPVSTLTNPFSTTQNVFLVDERGHR